MYIESKKDLIDFLEIEKKRYGAKSLRIPFFCIREVDFLWKHNILLRKTEYFTNCNKKIRMVIYKARLRLFQNRHHIHIGLNCFDSGLKIMHLGPILVNGKVKAGKNISLHINTSIVAGGTSEGVPILHDGIVVGVGAVILGDIKLAKNIAIGANSVVNKSFLEENITVAGVPAKKINSNGSMSWNKKSNK